MNTPPWVIVNVHMHLLCMLLRTASASAAGSWTGDVSQTLALRTFTNKQYTEAQAQVIGRFLRDRVVTDVGAQCTLDSHFVVVPAADAVPTCMGVIAPRKIAVAVASLCTCSAFNKPMYTNTKDSSDRLSMREC